MFSFSEEIKHLQKFSKIRQARSSYLPNEILWGYRFENMVSYAKKQVSKLETETNRLLFIFCFKSVLRLFYLIDCALD